MRFDNLPDWLAWQGTLHPCAVDLGLERTAEVAGRLGLLDWKTPKVTVAGTNGKGSCVAMLASIAAAAGLTVGTYTSPHLLRYNERVRVNRTEVTDADLIAAFAAVDRARGDLSLTFFEFGTLAAVLVLAERGVDLAVLEVGLGGRLDAVNVFDPALVLMTPVALDHREWLGDDRESVGMEKAGVLRRDTPVVLADRAPPESVLEAAGRLGCPVRAIGRDFDHRMSDGGWTWRRDAVEFAGLPLPALAGAHQLDNASAAIAAWLELPWAGAQTWASIAAGLETVSLPGRLESIGSEPTILVDVAHNPHGAAALAVHLRSNPVAGATHAVVGMLADKDIEGTLAALEGHVDRWYLGSLPPPRGATSEALGEAAALLLAPRDRYDSVEDALGAALDSADRDDRVLCFGSFLTVAAVLRLATVKTTPDTC